MSYVPDVSYLLFGRVYGGAPTSPGNLMVPDGTGFFVIATAANRALYGRTKCMARTAYSGGLPGGVELQAGSYVDPSITGIAAGAPDRWVRASATGSFEVFTPVNAGTSDIVGKADASGAVTLEPGIWTETMAAGGGGSYTPPTGTGVPHIVAGVQQAAASLIVDADVSASAAIVASKLAAGSNGQVLTTVAGVPTWAAANTTFDPTNLNLTSYVRASYAGSPWNGNATPGTSSSSLLSSGTPPTVGTAVNGFAPATFDGTTQFLSEPNKQLTSYFSASAYSYAMLVYVTAGSPAAPAANAYQDKQLFYGSGDLVGCAINTSGIRAFHYDGGFVATGYAAFTTNAWNLVEVFFAAGVLSVRVNGGTAATVSKASATLAGGFAYIGKAGSTPVFLQAQYLELWTAAQNLSAQGANYKAYLNSRYALSL